MTTKVPYKSPRYKNPEQQTTSNPVEFAEPQAAESADDLLLRLDRLDEFETVEAARSWLGMVVVHLPENVDKHGNPSIHDRDVRLYGAERPERALLREAGVTKAKYTAEDGTYVDDVSVIDSTGGVYHYRSTPFETTLTRTTNIDSPVLRHTEGVSIRGRAGDPQELLPVGNPSEAQKTPEGMEQDFIAKVTGMRVTLYTALSVDGLDKYGLLLDKVGDAASESHERWQQELAAEKKARSFGGRVANFLRRK